MKKQKVQELVELIAKLLWKRDDIDAVIWVGSSYWMPEENYNPKDIDIFVVTNKAEADIIDFIKNHQEIVKKAKELDINITIDIITKDLGWLRTLAHPLILGMFADGYKVIYAKPKVLKVLKILEKVYKNWADKIEYIDYGHHLKYAGKTMKIAIPKKEKKHTI